MRIHTLPYFKCGVECYAVWDLLEALEMVANSHVHRSEAILIELRAGQNTYLLTVHHSRRSCGFGLRAG